MSSIPSVNANTDPVSAPAPSSRAGNGSGFAALAASLARSDLAGARAAVAKPPAVATNPQQGDDALHASVLEGNLAAARVMLSLRSTPSPAGATRAQSAEGKVGTGNKIGTKAAHRDGQANSGVAGDIPPQSAAKAGNAVVAGDIVDVGATGKALPDVDVAAVLLALATGNAGNIPPEVINRYGPGGELYDPAAIMDAYRASPLGHAQMASLAWIGKPA